MSNPTHGGPEWYYAIPEQRRMQYEERREMHRRSWWADRKRDPKSAAAHLSAIDALGDELVREYPLMPYRPMP